MEGRDIPEARAHSLFAGVGGFETGMKEAGFRFEGVLECDKACCATLNANGISSEGSVSPTDIASIPPDRFSDVSVDYIVGGPPCQTFSAAGRRTGGVKGTEDPRGLLFSRYCLYVEWFRPKAFVLENVKGMLSSGQGRDFRLVCESFADIGYRLHWQVLNAACYGVPQLRERLFLVGVRDDLKTAFRFPKPLCGDGDKPFATAGEALKGISAAAAPEPYADGKYAHLIADIPPGGNYSFYTEEMGHPNPVFGWRTRFSNFLYKMSPDEPCRTLTASPGKYDGPFHWEGRKCSVDELKILQGFPKDYVFPHPYRTAVKQIGNSVCPPVARQIGMALRHQIEGIEELAVPLMDDGGQASVCRKKRKLFRGVDAFLSAEDESGSESFSCISRRTAGHSIDISCGEGLCEICFDKEEGASPVTEISVSFSGQTALRLKVVHLKAFKPLGRNESISLYWNEIHDAVDRATSYSSLLPLYGHFAEPHPKFSIKFESSDKSASAAFQKEALKPKFQNRVVPFSEFGIQGADEAYFLAMRNAGFDVRTSADSRLMPKGCFRICYPFPLPADGRRQGL